MKFVKDYRYISFSAGVFGLALLTVLGLYVVSDMRFSHTQIDKIAEEIRHNELAENVYVRMFELQAHIYAYSMERDIEAENRVKRTIQEIDTLMTAGGEGDGARSSVFPEYLQVDWKQTAELIMGSLQGLTSARRAMTTADQINRLARNLQADSAVEERDLNQRLQIITRRYNQSIISILTAAFVGFLLVVLVSFIIMHHTEASLWERARRDRMTGLLDHNTFLSGLSKAFHRALRDDQPVAALMIDIDHFKTFNDTYGHQVGDDVLITVVQLINAQIRSEDKAFRYGGEEITVILPGTTASAAAAIAERIRATIEEHPIRVGDAQVAITVSIGVGALTPGMRTPKDLITAADQAMYEAKRRGRNQVRSA